MESREKRNKKLQMLKDQLERAEYEIGQHSYAFGADLSDSKKVKQWRDHKERLERNIQQLKDQQGVSDVADQKNLATELKRKIQEYAGKKKSRKSSKKSRKVSRKSGKKSAVRRPRKAGTRRRRR